MDDIVSEILQTGVSFIVGFIFGYTVAILREVKKVLEECKMKLKR